RSDRWHGMVDVFRNPAIVRRSEFRHVGDGLVGGVRERYGAPTFAWYPCFLSDRGGCSRLKLGEIPLCYFFLCGIVVVFQGYPQLGRRGNLVTLSGVDLR